MINILNLEYGNAVSIGHTLESLEYPFTYVRQPSELKPGVLIVPGVGSIGIFSKSLKKYNWVSHIKQYSQQGNNIIGICLGLHALTAFSEESGGMSCINLLRGNIKTTAINKGSQKSNTGWLPFSIKKEFLDSNDFKPFYSRSRKKTLSGRVFYNHIYGANTSTKNSLQISGLDNFASVVVDKNILGIQFHPEKSQLLGKQFFEFIL